MAASLLQKRRKVGLLTSYPHWSLFSFALTFQVRSIQIIQVWFSVGIGRKDWIMVVYGERSHTHIQFFTFAIDSLSIVSTSFALVSAFVQFKLGSTVEWFNCEGWLYSIRKLCIRGAAIFRWIIYWLCELDRDSLNFYHREPSRNDRLYSKQAQVFGSADQTQPNERVHLGIWTQEIDARTLYPEDSMPRSCASRRLIYGESDAPTLHPTCADRVCVIRAERESAGQGGARSRCQSTLRTWTSRSA
ncbi:hypothetical protein C8R43DRAFT_1116206 [Mycena crocata]|nr:hypothetical protein C8R43DRAFT_1116206 [Mycena crocata]